MAISRRNRRGIAWLSALMPNDELNFSFEEIKQREAQLIVENSRPIESNRNNKKVKTYRIPDSKFDPNELLKQDWIEIEQN